MAIPELLAVLDVSGCIVTIDAIGCQRKIARTIVNQDADYVLAIKENQGHLYETSQDLFQYPDEIGTSSPASPAMPSSSCTLYVLTGESRTRCTGF